MTRKQLEHAIDKVIGEIIVLGNYLATAPSSNKELKEIEAKVNMAMKLLDEASDIAEDME